MARTKSAVADPETESQTPPEETATGPAPERKPAAIRLLHYGSRGKLSLYSLNEGKVIGKFDSMEELEAQVAGIRSANEGREVTLKAYSKKAPKAKAEAPAEGEAAAVEEDSEAGTAEEEDES